MKPARAALQLTRPDSSLLAFLSVLLPVFTRTQSLAVSLTRATPLLFVSMCTFIINDLDDMEKDKINHPQRPLPSGQIKPAYAAVLYYACLVLALLTIRFFIAAGHIAFWYYMLLIISISYSYIVEFLPGLKSAYVAAAVSIPILIVIAYFPQESRLYFVTVAVGFFTLGRELCMDIRDRPGDQVSFLHSIEPRQILITAFVLQVLGIALLSWQIGSLLDLAVVLAMAITVSLSYYFWLQWHREKVAIDLMKVVMLLGMYFLI